MLHGEPNLLSLTQCRKGGQVADPAHLAVKEPGVQRLSVALFEQCHKLLG
jgi:hypothetical protein